jgi:Uma2 family endonuclease
MVIMAASTGLCTVAEFLALPEDSGPTYHELRHGAVVAVTRPKWKHHFIQKRLATLLDTAAGSSGFVSTELAFRAVPEYDLRVADVAFVAQHRVPGGDVEDYFIGAPDLVIEVLSSSNTASEIFDKETLCLENGAGEFWVVDPIRRQVRVSTPDRRTVAYRAGEEIPLPMFGGAKLRVNAIFDPA